MNQIEAQTLITERFIIFKTKLVDEYPEYRKSFDMIISEAYDNGELWNLLEQADKNLNNIIENKGGLNNLFGSDYYKALCD